MARNVYFIDQRVTDYQTLIAGLPAGAEWHLINADEDGIQQIQNYLSRKSGYDSLQIISHGSEGTLYLGSISLSGTNISNYSTQLGSIGQSLTDTGDILIYGCNVAAGDAGMQFIGSLAQATGADVAASNDLTGATALGGDWMLESSIGTIDPMSRFGEAPMVSYQGILPATSISNGFRHPLGSGSLTESNDGDGYYVYPGQNFNDLVTFTNGNQSYHLGEDWNGEDGIDLGDPVYAISNGEVMAVVSDQGSSTTGFGNYVLIRHDLPTTEVINGKTVSSVYSLYAHLDSTSVSVGQIVALGTAIGSLGNSGNSEGPHLHFEMTLAPTLPTSDDGYNPGGAPTDWIDPTNFINQHRSLATTSSVSIDDVQITEGNSGTQLLTFTVSRTGGTEAFDVNYATTDAGAEVLDGDYLAQSGTLHFDANVNTQTISVTIIGDEKVEGVEAFNVIVSGITNTVAIGDGLGSGNIINDDIENVGIAGGLDITFGGYGVVSTTIGTDYDYINSMALQPDGKIILAGTAVSQGNDFALVRYNPNGDLDPTFSGDGILVTSLSSGYDAIASIALQSDGKIIVGGGSRGDATFYGNGNDAVFTLVRYEADGTLDLTFDGDGIVTTAIGTSNYVITGLALQNDGKIVVAGKSGVFGGGDFAVARYNIDGTLDPTFGNGGITIAALGDAYCMVTDLVLQADGKILVASGWANLKLTRFNTDGTLDNTFGQGGNLRAGSHGDDSKICLQADGKILVAGSTHEQGLGGEATINYDDNFALQRFNADGSWDTTFGIDGVVITDVSPNYNDVINGIELQPDGKIIVTGWRNYDPSTGLGIGSVVARYQANGSLDASFGIDGKIFISSLTHATDARLQSDGRILVAGKFWGGNNIDFGVVRLLNNLEPRDATDDYADEASDTTVPIGTITLGTPITATIGPADTDDTYGDKDVFKVSLTSGQTYQIHLQSTAVDGLPQGIFTIRAPGNFDTLLGTSTVGADVTSSFTATTTGDYYIRVGTGGAATDQGGYQLTVSATTGVDTIAPTEISFSPTVGAAGVDVTSFILVEFSEDVLRGSGNIVLKTASGNIVETYAVASNDSNLSISGNKLLINPSYDLAANTGYTVEIAAGSVKDSAGNSYAGTTSYNFTTEVLAPVDLNESLLLTMAQFSLAAYHLRDDEPRTDTSGYPNAYRNDVHTTATDEYNSLGSSWSYLSPFDIPALALVYGAGVLDWSTGLGAGIYTNQNASALVAHNGNKLVIAFRGTNDAMELDGDGDTSGWGPLGGVFDATPDRDHWDNKSGHYDLFQPLMTELKTYIANAGITEVYVTGHSLGAAMVDKFMYDHSDANGVTYQAVTFASPGYFIDKPMLDDSRIANFWLDGDAILTPSKVTNNLGDFNKLHAGYDVDMSGSDIHSMDLYLDVVRFMDEQGVDANVLLPGGTSPDVDDVYLSVSVSDKNTGDFRPGILDDNFYAVGGVQLGGDGVDILNGSYKSEVLIGGSNNDKLNGSIGSDTLIGGSGSDVLDGGNGADTYAFSLDDIQAGDVDVIVNFQPSDGDRILLTVGANTLSTAEIIALINTQQEFGLGMHRKLFFGDGAQTQTIEVKYVWGDLNLSDFILSDATTIKFFDGYIAGASIYIDSNGNGQADPEEDTGFDTDEYGNFTISTSVTAPVIAVGGTNIDTGLPNTLLLTAPAGSTIVSPLTTLIQTYAVQHAVDVATAEAAVQTALGIDASVDLTSFDPLAQAEDDAAAMEVQRANSQVAELGNIAQADGAIFANVANAIATAIEAGQTLDLADSGSLQQAVGGVVSSQAIEQAALVNAAIADATILGEIADIQTAQGSSGVILTGDDGRNTLNGSTNPDVLYGLGGNDVLTGDASADLIDGGSGSDKMTGGAGDDTYNVDNKGDKIVEKQDEGTDEVRSSIAKYTLGKFVENLTLTGIDHINGTGNGLVNALSGNAGNNILDGGKGLDSYAGGLGNDTYIIDDLLETGITEYGGEGTDTVKLMANSAGSYTLADNIENLSLTGSGQIDATGNVEDNQITGNAKNNTLTGLDGDDTLDGGKGVDTLVGGAGDDTYIVDKATDVVTELTGEGNDTIISNGSSYTLSDTSEVENLTIGKGAGKGTGNAQDNTLTGNDSANTLDGAAGNDSISGGKGADKLLGGEGADTLNGGLGNDKLTGNAGADIFVFNELLKSNVDSITDFLTGEDVLQLDTALVFTNTTLAADADGVLNATNFLANDSLAHLKAAQEADDFILYDNKAGVLYYDADGNGADFAAVKFATLTKVVGVAPTIDAGDIALV